MCLLISGVFVLLEARESGSLSQSFASIGDVYLVGPIGDVYLVGPLVLHMDLVQARCQLPLSRSHAQ